jgi:hypothetical protein
MCNDLGSGSRCCAFYSATGCIFTVSDLSARPRSKHANVVLQPLLTKGAEGTERLLPFGVSNPRMELYQKPLLYLTSVWSSCVIFAEGCTAAAKTLAAKPLFRLLSLSLVTLTSTVSHTKRSLLPIPCLRMTAVGRNHDPEPVLLHSRT